VGLQPLRRNWQFLVYCCQKWVYPLKRFLQNLAWGRKSHVRFFVPNFTVLGLNVWAYSLKNCEKPQFFRINLPIRENFGGPQKKLNIGAQLRTFLYAMTPELFWKYTASYHKLPHSKAWQTDKKHHTFLSTAGARPTISTILGMVIEEVRTIFTPP